MLDVFFTVDVEMSCNGWHNLDERFSRIFQQNIYGPTTSGSYGLAYQIKVLNDHNLVGVFFVEPLFSRRFGKAPLTEIVQLILEGRQELQMHLHTEWVDESIIPIFSGVREKQQHLRYFNLEEQTILIAEGTKLLRESGSGDFNAFRAGNFGFNTDTLSALRANNIVFDSSYNASTLGPSSGLMPGTTVVEPIFVQGVYEYPMTVFADGTRKLRHAQLTACSSGETEGLLWQALESGRNSFVILSHNFELLNPARDDFDKVVEQRFRKLCAFLDRNRDSFCVRGFKGLTPKVAKTQPPPLVSPIWRTGTRMLEQLGRRYI